ncbi:MAG TPA: transcriptional regulator [Desulfotomaculum sp.]|nr:transcriptional regulator [Desulfotomaculum sp.]
MFKDHIKTMRLRLGISQSELARRAGYSHEFISQVERGLKTPSIKALQKIALGLGVSPSILMESKSIPGESEEKLKNEVQLLINNLPVDKLKVLRDLLTVFPGQQELLLNDKLKALK